MVVLLSTTSVAVDGGGGTGAGFSNSSTARYKREGGGVSTSARGEARATHPTPQQLTLELRRIRSPQDALLRRPSTVVVHWIKQERMKRSAIEPRRGWEHDASQRTLQPPAHTLARQEARSDIEAIIVVADLVGASSGDDDKLARSLPDGEGFDAVPSEELVAEVGVEVEVFGEERTAGTR